MLLLLLSSSGRPGDCFYLDGPRYDFFLSNFQIPTLKSDVKENVKKPL